jgi:hypothetical protein
MANTNAPFGFSQYSGNGSAPTYEQTELLISATSSTNPQIFYGDPVAQLSTGTICQLGTNSTGGTGGGQTTGSGNLVGVFVGCKYLSVSQKRTTWSNYFPGIGDVNSTSTNYVSAYVITDPNAKFIVQTANSNTTATAVGASSIGQNIGVAFAAGNGTNTNTLAPTYTSNNGPGNTANGLSTAFADQYTLTTPGGTSATLPFRILGLANFTPDGSNPLQSINGNDYTSAYNRIIVGFNNAAMKSGVVGI